MNILAHIPKYKGNHNSGGESYIHEMLKGLNKIHHCRALTDSDSFKYEGIDVFKESYEEIMYRWADVVITHLGKAGRAVNKTRQYKKPLIHVFHSTHRKATVKPYHAIVYNGEWTKKGFDYTNRNIIFHPPTVVEDYKTEVYGDAYTLINCNENKGGHFLIELAKANPDKKFIGVLGSYGEQITEDVPNIKYIENTDRIKSVLAETRILLMPSKYESWGKAGIEAMCSGIPVLASNAPGLKESLGEAGVFADLDVEKWSHALRYIEDDYELISNKCEKRAKELEPDFLQLSEFIKQHYESYSKAVLLR